MIKLLLCEHGLYEEAKHGLLDLGVAGKLFEVVQSHREVQILQVALVSHLEPGVLQGLGSCRSVLRVH